MMTRTRRSVPTEGIHQWWISGWSYIMPDFDKKDHSIIEWFSDKAPVEPDNRVPNSQTEDADHERTEHRA